jgi:hypothetical protein
MEDAKSNNKPIAFIIAGLILNSMRSAYATNKAAVNPQVPASMEVMMSVI